MDCSTSRRLLSALLDGELAPAREAEVREHLELCSACARELALLSLPRRLGRTLRSPEPSASFSSRVRQRIEGTPGTRALTVWQLLVGLSRPIMPALILVTLLAVSVFFYVDESAAWVDPQGDAAVLSGEGTAALVDDLSDETMLHSLVVVDGASEIPAGPAPGR